MPPFDLNREVVYEMKAYSFLFFLFLFYLFIYGNLNVVVDAAKLMSQSFEERLYQSYLVVGKIVLVVFGCSLAADL